MLALYVAEEVGHHLGAAKLRARVGASRRAIGNQGKPSVMQKPRGEIPPVAILVDKQGKTSALQDLEVTLYSGLPKSTTVLLFAFTKILLNNQTP